MGTRRELLKTIGLGSLAMAASLSMAGPNASKEKRPNIVLILADDIKEIEL